MSSNIRSKIEPCSVLLAKRTMCSWMARDGWTWQILISMKQAFKKHREYWESFCQVPCLQCGKKQTCRRNKTPRKWRMRMRISKEYTTLSSKTCSWSGSDLVLVVCLDCNNLQFSEICSISTMQWTQQLCIKDLSKFSTESIRLSLIMSEMSKMRATDLYQFSKYNSNHMEGSNCHSLKATALKFN